MKTVYERFGITAATRAQDTARYPGGHLGKYPVRAARQDLEALERALDAEYMRRFELIETPWLKGADIEA